MARRLPRRRALMLALAVPAIARPAAAQEWKPTRQVSIIVPYPPGGFSDSLTRILAIELPNILGQNVVVENKPGASGRLGIDALSKAAPDGHTFAIVTPGIVSILPITDERYADMASRFTPLMLAVWAPAVIVFNPARIPAKTVPEFVEFIRQNPRKLNYGSLGVGSSYHIVIEAFLSTIGGDAVNVSYRGEAPAVQDLVAGQIDFMMATSTAIPHIKAGRVMALAALGTERWSALPELPTLIESGVKYARNSWFGYAGPPELPRPIVDGLNKALATALKAEAVKKLLDAQHTIVAASTPEQMRAAIAEESAEAKALITLGRVRVENN
ncbi:MAG TPA: tripartite tricarboxylate transporter substrate binding protein [Reyranella sp.]|nr:tripartite tricarboxylate transporter substrate binding protein [Reyranella sp.]